MSKKVSISIEETINFQKRSVQLKVQAAKTTSMDIKQLYLNHRRRFNPLEPIRHPDDYDLFFDERVIPSGQLLKEGGIDNKDFRYNLVLKLRKDALQPQFIDLTGGSPPERKREPLKVVKVPKAMQAPKPKEDVPKPKPVVQPEPVPQDEEPVSKPKKSSPKEESPLATAAVEAEKPKKSRTPPVASVEKPIEQSSPPPAAAVEAPVEEKPKKQKAEQVPDTTPAPTPAPVPEVEQPKEAAPPAAEEKPKKSKAAATPAAEEPAAAAKPAKKKGVEIKLRIQEKVDNQVVGCDITATSTMKFAKISAMYCAHRKYKADEWVFAVEGVLMEDDKTLGALGIATAGKTYIVNVYNKAKVNIA